ncbi:hypothetical protein CYMTET_32243 [Cymbomonas tetramitiformis]|uniref:CBS domain-containing protein n=1 Tax=Cymbomonas tetramitiformis TaxID=36881 RepID=A0AAE0KS52_9CHLO|nr:hypothetical protein CYMTET_32243 [Cymbomonas tetramitiformis]|eukprot:gene18333-21864_t
MAAVRNIFTDVRVQQVLEQTARWRKVVRQQDITLVKHGSTVGDALCKLSAAEVLSAPIIRHFGTDDAASEKLGRQDHKRYAVIGCADVNSILLALLQAIDDEDATIFLHTRESMTCAETNDLALKLNTVADTFFRKPIMDISPSDDGGVLYTSDLQANLLTLVSDIFLYPKNKSRSVHRLAVFDQNGEVCNMLSQSDVLRYIYLHRDKLYALAFETVERLHLATSPVATAYSSLPTVLAFKRLFDEEVSALAIVDEGDGHLIGNLSVSDLRGISPAVFGCLALPIAEFWKRKCDEGIFRERLPGGSHATTHSDKSKEVDAKENVEYHELPSSFHASCENISIHPLTCTPDSSLESVMRMIVENQIHRVYVIDNGYKPVGVVTITDILWALSGHTEECNAYDKFEAPPDEAPSAAAYSGPVVDSGLK